MQLQGELHNITYVINPYMWLLAHSAFTFC